MSEAPPDELAKWAGTLLLGGGGAWLVQRMLNGGTKAEDKEWRQELKADVSKILEAVGELKVQVGGAEKDVLRLEERLAAAETRADAQATAHRQAIADLRLELDRRLQAHESHCQKGGE